MPRNQTSYLDGEQRQGKYIDAPACNSHIFLPNSALRICSYFVLSCQVLVAADIIIDWQTVEFNG